MAANFMVMAVAEFPMLTADDNWGLLALVSGLLGFWLCLRRTTDDQL